VAAGLLAVMVGVFQLAMGLVRLGVLVNFVSHSVVVGFSTGAGVLIAVNQLRHLLGLEIESHNLLETVQQVLLNLTSLDEYTTLLGLGTIVLIVILKKTAPRAPSALISMAVASAFVWILGLNEQGVSVIGRLPAELPPLADLPLFDLDFIARLSTGALAVGAIGLVETTAISRSISAQTGQRLDSNQEFVGQGLANIAAGFFSGYPVAGSFSRSAVNFTAGARSGLSAIISSGFVLIGLFVLAPAAAYLPRAALSGVLIVTAYGMVDQREIVRILRGARGDALIMVVTFLGTLFLHIEFAVLVGILLSFAVYITNTSIPRVFSVLPGPEFKHFVAKQPDQAECPQLGIIKISGDLYFGAVNHVEESILAHMAEYPDQRFLLFRMHGVNNCDFSGIHALESIRKSCRDRGGDIYFMKVQQPVMKVMKATGFYRELGSDHFLKEEEAIPYLFHKVIDPAICIYECNVRAFLECQKLPKRLLGDQIPHLVDIPLETINSVTPAELWQQLHNGKKPLVIDVREPREYNLGHIPEARSIPLPDLLLNGSELPHDENVVLVCRGGRRSVRAAHVLQNKGYENLKVLRGGMLAWETENLLEAVDV
jgi:SulP family sulfate permease